MLMLFRAFGEAAWNLFSHFCACSGEVTKPVWCFSDVVTILKQKAFLFHILDIIQCCPLSTCSCCVVLGTILFPVSHYLAAYCNCRWLFWDAPLFLCSFIPNVHKIHPFQLQSN